MGELLRDCGGNVAVVCMQQKVPQYMTDFCIHTSDIARREHLRHRDTGVPCSVVGPLLRPARPPGWNSSPDHLRDPSRFFDSFRRDLTTFLFSFYWRTQRITGFAIVRYTGWAKKTGLFSDLITL